MTIRHPGRWFALLFVGLVAAAWLLDRTFSASGFTRALWLAYVVSSLLSLFLVSHRREARPGVVSIVATLAAAGVGWWVMYSIEVRWRVRWLLLGVAVTPVMSLANAAFRADVRRAQRRRDAQAGDLVEAVVAGQPVAPSAVYLRPFITTDRLMAQALPSQVRPMEVPVHLDLETVLSRAVRRRMPLVGLGRAGEMAEGIARVATTDDRWEPTMQAMTRDAAFIVMLPLAHQGTMTEVKWLVESGLLARTLFVMPEFPYEAPSGVWTFAETADRVFDAGVRSFDAQLHMLDLPNEWLTVTKVARAYHLELPPLAGCGALFTMDRTTGLVKTIAPLSLSTLVRPKRYLQWVLSRAGVWTAPAAGAPDFDTVFAQSVLIGGPTMEFALARAADGLVLWGDTAGALRLLHRARVEGQPHPAFVTGFVNMLPGLAEQRREGGDVVAADRYAAFAAALRADPELAALATSESLSGIAQLSAGMDQTS